MVNSDFAMSVSDRDFLLTHEQLIKACKVMLYKYNLQAKKSQMERSELTAMLADKMNKIEAGTKGAVAEVNTFLHSLSYDVETFVTKHKKEHTVLNERFLKLTEDVQSLTSTALGNQAAVSQYSTILACLVEFNAIEQALAVQDEQDRNQMQLMGGGKELKMPELAPTPVGVANLRTPRN